ncbi:regulatory factor, effector binding domain-containing protein, partial [Baffinella frigidus]
MRLILRVVALSVLASHANCFFTAPITFTAWRNPTCTPARSMVKMPATAGETSRRWQDLAERLVDPFVSPFDKPAIAAELAQMAPNIAETLQDVVSGKEKPEDALLGKEGKIRLRGARAVQMQIKEDILPDLQSEVRVALEKLQTDLQNGSPPLDPSTVVEGLRKQLDDATSDGRFPSLSSLSLPDLQEIQMEIRNIFQSMPEGLETPAYSVLESTEHFEIREYAEMVVAKTRMDSSARVQGTEFSTLAGFLFGDNANKEAMKMTMPVITDVREDGASTAMAFVIPSKNAPAGPASVPQPTASSSKEVNRQRSALVKALEAAGWVAPKGHAQVTVLQYNPPYTLPTVVIKLDGWGAPPGSAWTTQDVVNEDGAGGAPQNAFQEDAWKSG